MKPMEAPLLSFTILILAACLGMASTPVLAQETLAPDELCSKNPRAIASFADQGLEVAVRNALSIDDQAPLNCSLITRLGTLSANGPAPTRTVSGSPEWPDPEHEFDDLSGIQNLTGLKSLSLNNRGISDINLLKSLTNLTVLNLHTNWITDLSALAGMTKLTSLFLSENPISDISPLENLTALRVLRLHRHGDFIGGQKPRNFKGANTMLFSNAITDISPLSRMTELRDLNLHTQEISDLRPLSGLSSLIELRLAGNSFTDLSPLKKLRTLENLELTGNSLTDLTALSGLTNLQRLDLRYNPDLSDIQPLLDNPGIGKGDIIELRFTSVTCSNQESLAVKGVEVRTELFSACN